MKAACFFPSFEDTIADKNFSQSDRNKYKNFLNAKIAEETIREWNRFEYKIVDGKAFTEDRILIYNLFVEYCPSRTVMDSNRYFQQFGQVLDIHSLTDKNAFVYFAHPEDAAKALQANYSTCGGKLIPCCSLSQPDGQKLIEQLNRKYETTASENKWSDSYEMHKDEIILSLNDDCLVEICKRVSPCDQVNFALTCQRFFDIMAMVSKVEYQNLTSKVFDKFSLLKTRIFLKIVGTQVKSMDIFHNTSFTKAKFIGTFCTNVERLQLYCRLYYVQLILNKEMQELRELELISCKLNDDIIEPLKALKNLKHLSLVHCRKTKGINLYNELEKLTIMSSSGIGFITSQDLRNVCEGLKNLYYLDIRGSKEIQINESTLECLLRLKFLKIHFTPGIFHYLTQLPLLKQLEILVYQDQITHDFIHKLSEFHGNKLEEIKLVIFEDINMDSVLKIAKCKNLKVLHCYCTLDNEALAVLSQLSELEELVIHRSGGISTEGIRNFIEKSLKLKHLYFHDCYELTTDLIKNVVKLVQEQTLHSLRKHCLHLHCVYSFGYFGNYGATDLLKIIYFDPIPKYTVEGNDIYY